MYLDRYGKLQRDSVNPPRKDSFVVPNKGYIILRLFTDNPGKIVCIDSASSIRAGMKAFETLST